MATTGAPKPLPTNLTNDDINKVAVLVCQQIMAAVQRSGDRRAAEDMAAMQANLDGEDAQVGELYARATRLCFEIEARKQQLDDALARMDALMDQWEAEDTGDLLEKISGAKRSADKGRSL